jgi:nitrous oxide reductase accessory protein NosL
MNYTIIYIDDNGKYSAYKRFSSEEWYDAKKNRLVSDQKLLENLEEVYSESEK